MTKFGSLIKSTRSLRALVLAYGVGGTSQVLNSAVKFVALLYLVRILPPKQFGLYNIGLAASVAFCGIFTNLLIVPMTVSLVHWEPIDQRHYMARMLFAACVIAIATCGISLGAVGLCAAYGSISGGVSLLIVATTLLVIGMFAKESAIQIAYNEREEWRALVVNVATGFSLFVCYLTLDRLGVVIGAWMALAIFALAQLVGFFVGAGHLIVLLRSSILKETVRETRQVLRSGKWSAMAMFLFFIRDQAHTIIVTAWLGPGAVGAINAARIVFSPIQIVMATIVRASLPRLVHSRRYAHGKVFRKCMYAVGILVGITIAYCVLAYSFRGALFELFVGRKYQRNEILLLAWAVYMVVISARVGLEIFPKVVNRFQDLVGGNLIGSGIALVSVVVLTSLMQEAGSVLGIALAEFSVGVFLAYITLRGNYTTKYAIVSED